MDIFIYDAFGKMISEYGGLASFDEGGVKYVLQDWQGSSRGITSNTGNVQARMDYTAVGEEINAGTGQRTAAQGFGHVNPNQDERADIALNAISTALGAKATPTEARVERLPSRQMGETSKTIPANPGYRNLANEIRNRVCAK